MELPDAQKEQIKQLKNLLAETQKITQRTRELLVQLDSKAAEIDHMHEVLPGSTTTLSTVPLVNQSRP